nr:hypothetical protein [Cupriavidus sp. HMR-1]
MRTLCARLVLSAAVASLCACSSVGEISGAVAGITTGAVTANPVVGYGVAVGVSAAADAAGKYVYRYWQREEQDSIAAVIGDTPIGFEQPWEVRHAVAYGNQHGVLQVIRVIDSPLVLCKEALFSTVESETNGQPAKTSQWFFVTACQQQGQWKWANAEPAVARWGNLQ